MLPLEHSAILWPALNDNRSWKPFLVILRVAVLRRFYCNLKENLHSLCLCCTSSKICCCQFLTWTSLCSVATSRQRVCDWLLTGYRFTWTIKSQTCPWSYNERPPTTTCKWATICDFQQWGILTSVDSEEPVQSPFKLRNSKWCSVSSLTVIEYSSN